VYLLQVLQFISLWCKGVEKCTRDGWFVLANHLMKYFHNDQHFLTSKDSFLPFSSEEGGLDEHRKK